MSMEFDLPMMVKEDVGVVGKTMAVCRSLRMDVLLFSIIGRVCFTYKSYLIWN